MNADNFQGKTAEGSLMQVLATVDVGAVEASVAEISSVPSKADLQPADDTGVSNTDNITRNRNLSFNINNIANGATVEVYRDNILLSSTIVAGNGLTFSDNNLPADGRFVYKSRQVVNGNPSLYSAYLTVTIDNTAPTATISRAAGQFSPTTSQPLNFAVLFSENVVGLSL